LIEFGAKNLGGIDILINCARYAQMAFAESLTDEQFDETTRIDLYGSFYCSRGVFAHMKQKGGVIVNIASIAAVMNGKSIDTSMGFTPIEGLMMGTRVGDLDLGVLFYIMDKEKLSIAEASDLVNKKSGVLGVSGVSSDMREVEEAHVKGNKRAELALDMYHYRVKKYIGAYAAAMGGVDIIVFTGGIGENGPETREEICKGFEFLGLEFDSSLNAGKRGVEIEVSKTNSKVKVLVIPTDEELVIARDTYVIIASL